MEKICTTCGYRINPNTAKEAGLTAEIDPFLYNYCYMTHGFVPPRPNCPDWISYEKLDYEKKFFQEVSRRKRGLS